MPDEVLVNTADTPVSVRYTAKPALSGTLLEYNQNQTRPTVSIYKLLYLDVPEESVALSSYSVGDMVRIDYEYGGKKHSVCGGSIGMWPLKRIPGSTWEAIVASR